MPTLKDITGQRFGRLLVLSFYGTQPHGKGRWNCRCDCGAEVVRLAAKLLNGETRSCGCLRTEAIVSRSLRHGNARRCGKSHLYTLWNGMKERCSTSWPWRRDYYDRGIRVCERWSVSFEDFRDDILTSIGPRPSSGHSLDRVNNDGNYEPGNVRWATASQQNANKRAATRARDATGRYT